MKSKTKRLSALFMAFAMSVSVLQATAFAAHEVTPWVPGHNGHDLAVVEDSVNFEPNGKVNYTVECTEKDCKETTKIFAGYDQADVTTKKAASCTAPASVTYEIKILGKTFTKSFTENHPLGHNYQYTFVWPTEKEKPYVSNQTLYQREALGVTVKGVCTRCGHERTFYEGYHPEEHYQLIINEDYDKRINNVKCKAGSVTFQGSFAITDVDPSAYIYKTVALNETKAYPYFSKYVAHTPSSTRQIENEDRTKGYYDLVTRCTVCNEVLKSERVSTGEPAHKHTAGKAVKENVVKSTYAKAGSYDLTTRCTDCGQVLDRVHKTTAKLKVNAPTLSKVKNVKGKKATVAWKKASSVNGYQVQYATKSSFKSAKTVKTTASSKTLSKLSKNKKYYVRVRSYKVSGGKTYYSSWSKVKTVTVKK